MGKMTLTESRFPLSRVPRKWLGFLLVVIGMVIAGVGFLLVNVHVDIAGGAVFYCGIGVGFIGVAMHFAWGVSHIANRVSSRRH